MELEELKRTWKNWELQEEVTPSLSKEKLILVIRKKYKLNFIKIFIPKLIMGGLHLFGALFLILFFSFFEQPLHIFMAAVAIFLFVAIPFLSFFAFVQYYQSGNVTVSLNHQITSFHRKGKQFIRLQYFLTALRVVLLSVCVVLFPLLYSENLSLGQILVSVVVGAMIILFLSHKMWLYYKKRILHIENLLESLQ